MGASGQLGPELCAGRSAGRSVRNGVENRVKDKEALRAKIIHAMQNPLPDYGGNVLPAMEIYKGLKTHEERTAYEAAIEDMLKSEDAAIRKYAVKLCLGFFVFGDALRDGS